jgi:hypothetical protein
LPAAVSVLTRVTVGGFLIAYNRAPLLEMCLRLLPHSSASTGHRLAIGAWAVALLRAIYDMVERIKHGQAPRGLEGLHMFGGVAEHMTILKPVWL